MEAEQPNKRRLLTGMLALSATLAVDSVLGKPKAAHAISPAIHLKNSPEFSGFSTAGINIDPQILDCNTDFLKELGVSWVRFTLKRQHDYSNYLNQLAEAKIQSVCVIEKETIKIERWEDHQLFDQDYLNYVAEHYAKKYPQIEFLQVGNEMDDAKGFSSWTTPQSDYNKLLNAFAEQFVGKYLIAGGLSTGKPNYLDKVDLSKVRAIAVHPYGVSTPDFKSNTNFTDAENAFTRYKSKTNLPILISEAGVNHEDYTPEKAAEYVRSLMEFYQNAYVLGAAYFCLSDLMVDHHGLFDKTGQPKPSLEAFLKSTHGETNSPNPNFQLTNT